MIHCCRPIRQHCYGCLLLHPPLFSPFDQSFTHNTLQGLSSFEPSLVTSLTGKRLLRADSIFTHFLHGRTICYGCIFLVQPAIIIFLPSRWEKFRIYRRIFFFVYSGTLAGPRHRSQRLYRGLTLISDLYCDRICRKHAV